MQYIGLIGQSISASRSPSLHNMLGELKQLPVSYELQELDSSAVEAFTERLSLIREKGFIGTNVTFPFKQIAVDSADEVNDSVKKVGSTNTLLLKDGKVCAPPRHSPSITLTGWPGLACSPICWPCRSYLSSVPRSQPCP